MDRSYNPYRLTETGDTTFELQVDGKAIQFRASSGKDAHDWVEIIRRKQDQLVVCVCLEEWHVMFIGGLQTTIWQLMHSSAAEREGVL